MTTYVGNGNPWIWPKTTGCRMSNDHTKFVFRKPWIYCMAQPQSWWCEAWHLHDTVVKVLFLVHLLNLILGGNVIKWLCALMWGYIMHISLQCMNTCYKQLIYNEWLIQFQFAHFRAVYYHRLHQAEKKKNLTSPFCFQNLCCLPNFTSNKHTTGCKISIHPGDKSSKTKYIEMNPVFVLYHYYLNQTLKSQAGPHTAG